MARSKEKSPEARAPKFVGALKVVPKLVASDQKAGRSWVLDIYIYMQSGGPNREKV